MRFRRPLILLLLAALLPLALLAAALGVYTLRQQERASRQEAVELVRRTALSLEQELRAQVEILRTLAEAPLFDGPLEEDRFFTLGSRIRANNALWDLLTVSDLEGHRLTVVPQTGDPATGSTVVDLESHERVIATKTPVVGSIVVGPLGRETFPLRVPVVRDGKVKYVLTALVAPGAVGTLLLHNFPAAWLGGIIDAHGNFVARTKGGAAMIGKPASASVQRAMTRGGSGFYEGRTLEGVSAFTAYRVLPGSHWSIHIAIPTSAFRAPLIRAFALIAIGGVVSLLIAGLFIFLLVREEKLRRRQDRLLEDAHRFEALGRMTGGVAHDFNNILMIAQGSAEGIKRRRGEPEHVEKYTDAILAAVQRGQTLTRQLLAFARRSAHEPVSFDLNARAPALSELLRSSTRGDIKVELALPQTLWPVYADPSALEVALVNLSLNARDAMPKGGVLTLGAANVSLSARDDDETGLTGDFVQLTLRDTGVGIPPDTLTRIFEPFFTTKPAGQGTGLGLSQVFGFATQSGGTVRVESVEGEGTVFTLYLPRALGAPVKDEVSEEPRTDVEGRFLLVEDNPEVASVTQAMLAGAGYSVQHAKSGAEALAAFAQTSFDIVLTDIVLGGGMSGLELAQALREKNPALPIVLMTGYSEALARGTGGFPVLMKPFGQIEALRVLRAAHSGRRVPRAQRV